ncbi:MAG: hypothetical protein P8Y71_00485 [Pseudolabrys sp.]
MLVFGRFSGFRQIDILVCGSDVRLMFTAAEFRVNAAEYVELLRGTENPNEVRNLNRLKESFTCLAHSEDWLAHNFDPSRAYPVHRLDYLVRGNALM